MPDVHMPDDDVDRGHAEESKGLVSAEERECKLEHLYHQSFIQ